SSGSYGGFAHTGHTSASDALPVMGKCRPESIIRRSLSQRTQSWSSQLHVLGRLGSGGRAVVDEVWIKGHTRTMALKTFKSSLQKSSREWRREVETMTKLKEHPHIVKLVRVLKQNSSALLIQPVADYDLNRYLGSYTATLKEQRNILHWFSCLASGLEYIHQYGLLHNDIKPQNILVEDQRVLFTDFGSSSTIDETRRLKMRAFHHTKLYAAPEVDQGDYTTASDVWSLGCVFIEMATTLISGDMWTQLRAFQSSFYHQPMSIYNWALEWRKQIMLYSDGEAIGNRLGPIFEFCGKMTQFKHEKRPNAADLYRQVNSLLDCQCEYGISFARQSDKPLSRKCPNQGTEKQYDRLAQPRDFKAAEKSANVTMRSGLLDVGASSIALRSEKSLGWKSFISEMKPPPPRRKGPVKAYSVKRVNVLSNVTSFVSNTAVSDPSNQSAPMDVNRANNAHCDASLSRLKPMDWFLDDNNALEDFKVSGGPKHNETDRRMRHLSNLSALLTKPNLRALLTNPNLCAPTLGQQIKKTKSLPSSTECAVVTKTGNNISWTCSPNCSSTHRMKDFGSQFPTSGQRCQNLRLDSE
ncbi:MAG: hypothetical protein Q9214_003862, partial [Letrouitia sp. 1 TL-2023]